MFCLQDYSKSWEINKIHLHYLEYVNPVVFKTKHYVLITLPFLYSFVLFLDFQIAFLFSWISSLFSSVSRVLQIYRSSFVPSYLTPFYLQNMSSLGLLYSCHSSNSLHGSQGLKLLLLTSMSSLPWFNLSFFWTMSFPKTSYVGGIFSECLYLSNCLFMCLIIQPSAEF